MAKERKPMKKEKPIQADIEVTEALARGYCYKKNENKVLDADLIKAMAKEIIPMLEEIENATREECRGAINVDMHSTIKKLENEVERLRVQLAGCGVAAQGYAKGKNDCKKGGYGWSASFQDVKDLYKKYISALKGRKV